MKFKDLRNDAELIRLAGLLSSRPISDDSYKLDESLRGLATERSRLGQRKFLVMLNQKVYDIDGLTDYVFLLDSFETQSSAIAHIEAAAKALYETQINTPGEHGAAWHLESRGDIQFMSQPKASSWAHSIRVLYDQTYKLRAGPYDTKYSCFRAIGPFHENVVGDELFSFVNEPFELWSYFVDISEAARNGAVPSQPL